MQSSIRFLADICCYLLGCLPRSWVRAMGSLLGVLWHDVLRIRRQVILDNLQIAFPQMSLAEKKRISRISTYNMGANFLEAFLVPSMNSQWLEKNVVFHGLEYLQKARSGGQGVLLLGMHLGNGDITASSLSLAGEKIVLISKFFKNALLNAVWFHIRGRQGVQFIEPHGDKTAFSILKALKQGAAVAFVLDQFMGRPYALETSFFGRKTGTAYGLALFYLKTKAPILPVYAYQGEDGKYHLVVEPVLQLENLLSEDKENNLLVLTQKFNDEIEKAIRKHPQDWMWVHRRWKEYE